MKKLNIQPAFNLVRECLTDELRKPKYRGHPNKYWGHCYVATEALFHLISRKHGYKPYVLSCWDVPGLPQDTHWFLMIPGICHVLDPTYDQFEVEIPWDIYQGARCCGFLTKRPSKRAQILIKRVRARVAEKDNHGRT